MRLHNFIRKQIIATFRELKQDTENMKRVLTIALTAICASAALGQTMTDINPLYSKVDSKYMSLLLRESPQSLKKIYGKYKLEKVNSKDTVWVAPLTKDLYGKMLNSMHWPVVTAELDMEMPSIVPAQTSISIPAETDTSTANADSAATDSAKMAATKIDSSLFCNANSVVFKMVRVTKNADKHKTFLIGETEVTQGLWIAVMYSNPSEWTDVASGWPCYNRPVENINWKEANTFIEKLNKMTGRKFRLPTAKEWELAANGGENGNKHKWAGSDTTDLVAWYKHNYIVGAGTQEVGQKRPNSLGIYDMSGNVWEMCADNFWRRGITYSIIKGGCANATAKECTSNFRKVEATDTRSQYIGFRLAEDE
jgi:formylglycine-generating enzyme required for sulfatase activity